MFQDGRIIGTQAIGAMDFGVCGEIETGSWLGQEFQGRGYGKEMRAAVLHLAFEGLGAQAANSEAFYWNAASISVSRSLGYEPNGEQVRAVEGKPVLQRCFRLTSEVWRARTRPSYDVTVEGLATCLDMFGVEETKPNPPS